MAETMSEEQESKQLIDISKLESRNKAKKLNDWRRNNYDPFRNVKYFQKRKKPPEDSKSLMNAFLKKSGLQEKFAPYSFVKHWNEIVGPHIATHTEIASFQNGLLVINVDSSSWAQELIFQKSVILKRLKKHLPDGYVLHDVYFSVNGKKVGNL